MYNALMRFDGQRKNWSDLSPEQQKHLRRAVKLTKDRFTLPRKIQPLDWHEVGAYLKPDTSAGITWPGKKKGDVMEEIYPAARWLGHRMKQGGKRFNPSNIHFPPCTAARRGAMSSRDDPKTRLVWIYPAEMLTVEGLYAPRMYEEFTKLPDSPLLNGKSPSRMASSLGASHSSVYKKLGMDFSSFDATVPSFLIPLHLTSYVKTSIGILGTANLSQILKRESGQMYGITWCGISSIPRSLCRTDECSVNIGVCLAAHSGHS
jgi:hypothetical protein